MAAPNFPPEKKIRLGERERFEVSDSVLQTFRKDARALQRLKIIVGELSEKSSGLCMVKILDCSGDHGDRFSNIYCKLGRNFESYEDTDLIFFSFKSIFQKGWKLLKTYIEDSAYEPSNLEMKLALEKLIIFMMTVDGHEETWHSCVDILLGSMLPIVNVPVTNSVTNSAEQSYCDRQNTLQVDDSSIVRSRRQMIGQTIVFSFLQMQLHPEFKNFLIPTVGLSKENVVFLFYDARHDILLESPPLKLLNGGKKINHLTMLATWLVLNYNIFGTGITTDMFDMNYNADFPIHAKDKLEIYKTKLHFNCRITKSVEAFTEPWSISGVQVKEGKPVDEDDVDIY